VGVPESFSIFASARTNPAETGAALPLGVAMRIPEAAGLAAGLPLSNRWMTMPEGWGCTVRPACAPAGRQMAAMTAVLIDGFMEPRIVDGE
jgi:hypothetical protein